MAEIMYIFPGQGSQYKGIGKDLYSEFDVAKDIYDQANEVLGYDFVKLSFDDEDHKISLTEFTQPVLLTHQIACLAVFNQLTENHLKPKLMAGHSLGEYAALVTSGCISFEDGLKLVSRRGQLMGAHGEGSMLALPLNYQESSSLAEEYNCQVATINLEQQTVVGGTESNIDYLQEGISKLYPKKRTVKLDTEGAFHTDLMTVAAEEFKNTLSETNFSPMKTPVLSNHSTEVHNESGCDTADLLFHQLYKTVNWLGCMRTSVNYAIDTIIEFGGGIGGGKEPSEKRPNLEAITKKNFRGFKHEISYYAAINTSTINETANSLGNA